MLWHNTCKCSPSAIDYKINSCELQVLYFVNDCTHPGTKPLSQTSVNFPPSQSHNSANFWSIWTSDDTTYDVINLVICKYATVHRRSEKILMISKIVCELCSRKCLNCNKTWIYKSDFDSWLWHHQWRNPHQSTFCEICRSWIFDIWYQIETMIDISKFSKWPIFWDRRSIFIICQA